MRIADKVLSEEIDKNGTRIQRVETTCSRCGGAGGFKHWPGFTCFDCGGNGREVVTNKIYTPEHEAKLARDRERRHQKALEKARAAAGEKNAKTLTQWGYDKGSVFLTLGNTFPIKDQLKEAGAKWSTRLGEVWFFSEKPEQWPTLEVKVEELIYYSEYTGEVHHADVYDEMKERVRKASNAGKPVSEWVGEIGGTVEGEFKVVRSTWVGGYSFSFCINILEDSKGNTLVWKTGRALEHDTDDNGKIKLKGTIKDHDEYNGTKQTQLTRCRVLKK